MNNKRQLILMRHAKSSWTSGAESDFDRPLNARGKRDALKMGKWLFGQNIIPNVIISSPALRTEETAIRVCEKIKFDPEKIRMDQRIYEAGLGELLKVLAAFPSDVKSILLIGHNPGIEYMTLYLSAEDVRVPANGKLIPTATLVLFQMFKKWSDLSEKDGEIINVVRPKELH